MNDEPKGVWGCIAGIFEMIGFSIALTWPILLLFLIGNNKP